jgi:hypothetical protein
MPRIFLEKYPISTMQPWKDASAYSRNEERMFPRFQRHSRVSGHSVGCVEEAGNTSISCSQDFIHAVWILKHIETLFSILFLPSFALRSNRDGSLPLHYACSALKVRIHASTYSAALDAAPSCASRVNNSKDRLPLHLTLRLAQRFHKSCTDFVRRQSHSCFGQFYRTAGVHCTMRHRI